MSSTMAKHTISGKALDPNASPYHKINTPTTPYCLYLFPPPPPPPRQYSLILPPFYTYNTKLQPSLIPVPAGPRIPKSHRRNYRLKNINHDCTAIPLRTTTTDRNNGNGLKWIPKFRNKQPNFSGVEKLGKRWKNSSREYQRSLPLETDTTSLMIKNIPNKYTRQLLIQTLDSHCKLENQKKKMEKEFVSSAFDFLYLPIDFKCRVNAGFAFVNFTTPEAALRFRDAFDGKRWNFFDSSKVAEISRARIQGKRDLINNCKGMDFAYGSQEDMPVWFKPARDGSSRIDSRMFTVGKWAN